MTANSHPLALPPTFSPDDLDPLTELSLILTRVRAGIQASNGNGTGSTANTTKNNGGTSGINDTAAGGGGADPQQQQQLSFKDVHGATDSLKHKLQRARTQVCALPDMDRTIEEQERDMAELEKKIETQRALLGRLKESGNKFGKEEDGRGGGEQMDMS